MFGGNKDDEYDKTYHMKKYTQLHVDKEQSQLLSSLHVGLGNYFSKVGKNSAESKFPLSDILWAMFKPAAFPGCD